jgi:DNA repair exonuclease SbcCD ATPase subunit
MPDLTQLRDRAGQLVRRAEVELAGWQALLEGTHGALEQVEALRSALGAIQPPSVSPEAFKAAGMQVAAHAQTEIGQQLEVTARTLTKRVQSLLDRLPNPSDLDGGRGLLDGLPGADHIRQRLQAFDESVSQPWVEVIKALSLEASQHASSVNAALEELEAAVALAQEEVLEELSALGDALREAVEDAVDDTEAHLQSVLGETVADLEAENRTWEDRLASLEGSFEQLEQEVQELGRSLNSVYALVMEGMRSSAVGMEAAASALDDLRSVMTEVN